MKLSRICEYLLVIFITLKLTGLVAWSWWLITAPLWGYAVIALIVGFVIGFSEAVKPKDRINGDS